MCWLSCSYSYNKNEIENDKNDSTIDIIKRGEGKEYSLEIKILINVFELIIYLSTNGNAIFIISK